VCVCDVSVRSFEHFLDQLIRRFTLRKPVLEGQKSVEKVGIAIVTQDDCLLNPLISAKLIGGLNHNLHGPSSLHVVR
jgi:hypothetical protein